MSRCLNLVLVAFLFGSLGCTDRATRARKALDKELATLKLEKDRCAESASQLIQAAQAGGRKRTVADHCPRSPLADVEQIFLVALVHPEHVTVMDVGPDIELNGETLSPLHDPVRVDLENGAVPEALLQGQLIRGLHGSLGEWVQEYQFLNESIGSDVLAFGLLLAVDDSIPFETVRQITYTAAQAQLSSFHYLVRADGKLVVTDSGMPSIGPPCDEEPCDSFVDGLLELSEKLRNLELPTPEAPSDASPDTPTGP